MWTERWPTSRNRERRMKSGDTNSEPERRISLLFSGPTFLRASFPTHLPRPSTSRTASYYHCYPPFCLSHWTSTSSFFRLGNSTEIIRENVSAGAGFSLENISRRHELMRCFLSMLTGCRDTWHVTYEGKIHGRFFYKWERDTCLDDWRSKEEKWKQGPLFSFTVDTRAMVIGILNMWGLRFRFSLVYLISEIKAEVIRPLTNRNLSSWLLRVVRPSCSS